MRTTRLAVALCTVALGASFALAQPRRPEAVDLTEVRPPAPTKQDAPPIITSWFLVALLGGGAIGANLIPSKRGHQD